MSDPFTDFYWQNEFRVTQADLRRIADFLRETCQAYDLTTLAQRIVLGRLRHGADQTQPVLQAIQDETSVRLWDPAASWHPGDRVIVAVGHTVGNETIHSPYVGEVIEKHSGKVRIQIDSLGEHRDFRTEASAEELNHWRNFVEKLVDTRRNTQDEKTQIEYVLFQFGEQIVTKILTALKHDTSLVELNGRWFLRELTIPASDMQIENLAWAMLSIDEPKSTSELVTMSEPPLVEGDPGLFGLYLTLRQYPKLFENTTPGLRPHWRLINPPNGPKTASHAAYDPKTYEILCMPGETLTKEQIQRLWELNLLQAIV